MGAAGFYEFALPDASAPVLALTPDCSIMAQRKRNAEALRQAEQEAKAARERREAKRKAETVRDGLSPVEHFNAAHGVSDLLARYGYERDGRSDDWRSPFQTSGSFATRDYGDHWISLSGSDAAQAIGQQTKNGYRFGDAFDLFCHFEHGGDFKAAVRSHAQEADLDKEQTFNAFDSEAGDSGATDSDPPKAKRASAFTFTRVGDLKYRPPEYLVGGLLETETLGLIFGDPGCGKSFLAVDLALCVATGTPFHGREVKQGPVFLIAGEGHNGLTRRFAAWGKARGVDIKNAPLFVSNRPAQFLDEASAREVVAAVHELAAQHGKPALIEIDTVARNFGPGDENSTAEMGKFIAAIDGLKAEFPGSSALLVHHTGHSDKARARGAMALKGALDCEYRVAKDEAIIKLINTKMKDAEPPAPIAFELESVELDEGASSAVLVETEVRKGAKPLTRDQTLALHAFQEAAAQCEQWDGEGEFPGLPLEPWREVFYKWHTGETPAAKRQAFGRARKALVECGRLTVEHDIYRPTDEGDLSAILLRRRYPEGVTA